MPENSHTAVPGLASMPEITSPVGLDDPSLALHLSRVTDYGTSHPFLNIMYESRPMYANNGWETKTLSHIDLLEDGYLTADGWPSEIPPGTDSIQTRWEWSAADTFEGMGGRYVVTWDGEGTLQFSGTGLTVIEQTDDTIIIEITEPTLWFMTITETDPNGTGDYLRDVTIVHEDFVDLHEAGARFRPDFLALIEDARVLRFKDWANIDDSSDANWDARVTTDHPSYHTGGRFHNVEGLPVEEMIALANLIGADPWFCIPLDADAAYIEAFAQIIKDELDPRLTATFELSNETWNTIYSQYGMLVEMVKVEWGIAEPEYADINAMHTKLAVEAAQIIDGVFATGDGAEGVEHATVQHVMASHVVNPGATNQRMTANSWATHEADAYVDPATVFDAIAVTTYFGNSTIQKENEIAALEAAIADPTIDPFTWLKERLLDPDHSLSVPFVLGVLEEQKALAESYGLGLVLYEGGQHVDSYATGSSAEVDAFIKAFVKSPEMADLYQVLWDGWVEIGDGPFMHFSAITPPTVYGSWGLYENAYDTSPRSDLLEDLNETTPAWFDEGGSHYQQGVILDGDVGDDVLAGTTEEDFLIGAAGNDTLAGGAGDDGLHGGAGNDVLEGGSGDDTIVGGAGDDVAQYRDSINAYTIEADGSYTRVTARASGDSDLVSEVEKLLFTDALYEVETRLLTVAAYQRLSGTEANETIEDIAGAQLIDGGAGQDRLVLAPAASQGLRIQTLAHWQATQSELSNDFGATLAPDGSMTDAAYFIVPSGRVPTGPDGTTPVSTFAAANTYGIATALDNGDIAFDFEVIVASDYNDTFFGRDHDDHVIGGAGNDTLIGNIGNDTLAGGDDQDLVRGEDGNDLLSGEAGNDIVNGGLGNDTVSGGAGDDTLRGGDGIDTALFEKGLTAYTISIDGEDITVVDEVSGDRDLLISVELLLFNDAQFDVQNNAFTLFGTSELNGTDGDDTIVNIAGSQLIDGRAGVDTLELGTWATTGFTIQALVHAQPTQQALASGNSVTMKSDGAMNGAAFAIFDPSLPALGPDQTIAADHTTAFNMYGLSTALQNGDIAVGFERISGTDFDDVFLGLDHDDHVIGGAGNDTLTGNGGSDHLEGGIGDDVLTGNDGIDILTGGEGNDLLSGDAGNDTLDGGDGNDTLQGGDGHDTALFDQNVSAFTLATEGDVLVVTNTGTGEVDRLIGIDQVTFSDVRYDVAADRFVVVGTDRIDGTAGDDLLQDVAGHQLIAGGAGIDTLDAAAAAQNGLRIQALSHWQQTQVELSRDYGFAIAQNGAMSVAAYSIQDTTMSATGADTIAPGDHYDAFNTLGVAGALLNGDIVVEIEAISGSNQDDFFFGRDHDDHFIGAAGNDNLVGNEGNDTLDGGEGADKLTGAAGADDLSGGDGNDVLNGGDGDDVLDGGAGDDKLAGGDGDDTLRGGSGNNRLKGGEDHDLFVYEDGLDTLFGGGGTDTIAFDDYRRDELVFEGSFNDFVVSDTNGTILAEAEGVENVRFADTAATTIDIFSTPVVGAPFVYDDASNRFLDAGKGYNTVVLAQGTAGEGVMILALNPYAPTMQELGSDPTYGLAPSGGMSSAAYFAYDPASPLYALDVDTGAVLQNGYGVANHAGVDGALANGDLIVRAEELDGTESRDLFYGRDHDDVFWGFGGNDQIRSAGGNDTVRGGNGADWIEAGDGDDLISGEAGADTIFAGRGDDVILYSKGGDTVDGGDGFDTIEWLSASMADVSITTEGTVFTVLDAADDSILAYLTDVERIVFQDGVIDIL